MSSRLLNTDFIGGIALVAFGSGYLWAGSQYDLGVARNMGPGYFPFVIGILIVLIGGIQILRGLLQASAPPEVKLRPIGAISASIASFWALIGTFGLVPAILVAVALSSFAESGPRVVRIMALTVFLIAMSWAVFILALGLPLRLFRWP